MKEKVMVADTLAGINASLASFGSMIPQTENEELRQLEEFTCCQDFNFLDFGTISASVKEALTNEKINYYRKLIQQPMPNTQIPK